MFPKIMVPPNHPWINRVFHYINHPFWGPPIFGHTHISPCFPTGEKNRKPNHPPDLMVGINSGAGSVGLWGFIHREAEFFNWRKRGEEDEDVCFDTGFLSEDRSCQVLLGFLFFVSWEGRQKKQTTKQTNKQPTNQPTKQTNKQTWLQYYKHIH